MFWALHVSLVHQHELPPLDETSGHLLLLLGFVFRFIAGGDTHEESLSFGRWKNRWRKKQEFEATQYPQDAQERADLTNQRHVLVIRNAHKTVEVPRVQYIDKVADIPVDTQRQVSTLQATLRRPTFQGPTLRGPTLGPPTLRGPTLRRPTLRGQFFLGWACTLRGHTLGSSTLRGPRGCLFFHVFSLFCLF